PDAAGLLRGREDEPLPDPRATAARSGRTGGAVPGPGRRPGRPARAGAAPAPAEPAGGPRRAGGHAGVLPRRGAGGGGAQARVVVDRPGAARAGGARRGAVLGGPPGPAGDAVVAYRRLRLPATARGRRHTLAEVRPGRAALLGT